MILSRCYYKTFIVTVKILIFKLLICGASLVLLDQGGPHFLCGWHKSAPLNIGGHKNIFKKAWRAKLDPRKP